jgi:hypothetical protein
LLSLSLSRPLDCNVLHIKIFSGGQKYFNWVTRQVMIRVEKFDKFADVTVERKSKEILEVDKNLTFVTYKPSKSAKWIIPVGFKNVDFINFKTFAEELKKEIFDDILKEKGKKKEKKESSVTKSSSSSTSAASSTQKSCKD